MAARIAEEADQGVSSGPPAMPRRGAASGRLSARRPEQGAARAGRRRIPTYRRRCSRRLLLPRCHGDLDTSARLRPDHPDGRPLLQKHRQPRSGCPRRPRAGSAGSDAYSRVRRRHLGSYSAAGEPYPGLSAAPWHRRSLVSCREACSGSFCRPASDLVTERRSAANFRSRAGWPVFAAPVATSVGD